MVDVGLHKKGEVSLELLLRRMRKKWKGRAGAFTCFVGMVRGRSEGGRRVKYLHYESAEKEALDTLRRIAKEGEGKEGILEVSIHHVVGDLKPGEEALYVVIASRHRKEAFSLLPRLMDRLKSEVPIWKKEVYGREGRWIEG
ncbi:MAG: molybdenum cofactor biosynthesis protein MoaE [Candidatus Hadarchaeales archaeon]